MSLRKTTQSAYENRIYNHIIPEIGCKLPPKKGREMQVLTREEMQRFLIQAKFDGYFEILLIALTTGMRRG